MYTTGQKAPAKGRYQFVRYTDDTTTPSPTAEERIIPLDKGEKFPPVKSSGKAAWWRKI
jgi:hypothetical protein